MLLFRVLVKLMLYISRVPCFSGIVFTQLANLFTLVTGIPWLLLTLTMTLLQLQQKQRRLIFLPVCNLFFWFCLWCAPSVLAGHRCHGRGGESYGPAEPHFGGGSDHTTDKIIIHFCQYPHRSAELTMCKLKSTFYIVFK